ncbi:MAG TPA: aldehyde dehydrogenase family protein [Acidimicrobiales bacterium]|nr:aldehyde dehydrogenase family protein [Acidimicrobiales bacterium]
MWHEERLLIDGDLVPAEGGRTYETIDPTSGEPLGSAANASVGDATRAVEAARRAFDTTSWATDVALRTRCLRQLHDALVANQEDLRRLLIAEVGLPHMLTQGPGLDTPVGMVGWYADLLDKYEFREDLGVAEVRGGLHARWVEKEPVGVVSAIVPYNFPVQITLAKLVPALAAGCTVVVKGPPQTPWIAAAIGKVVAEHTDIPRGVVNVLTSDSVEVGEVLVTDPRVDMVSFTGSTTAGRRIMAAASETVKKTFLELGGKSAFVVLDDAEMELAAMFAGFTICSHAGQGCAITSRLLVPEARLDEVVELTAKTMAGVPFGDPRDPGMMMGPLISEAHRERVEGHLQRAVAEGATVVTGGKRPGHLPAGYFYEPTLLTGVGPDSAIAQEEVFGPVLVVLPYHDDDDAVAIANNSIFGLSGAVYGADDDRATNLARRLRAGTVSVNGGMYYGPDAPFGGYKQSGIGREMGVPGLDEYLEMKTIARPAG